MMNRLILLSFILLFATTKLSRAQEAGISCELPPITNPKDHPNQIPGNSMGQKLESLLFWNQKEKERRFPLMQSIYPSLPVNSGTQVHPLLKDTFIQPQWQEGMRTETYMKQNHIAGILVLQKGKIKLEVYAPGVHQQTLWTSYSVAKSVSSMLVGVALKEGLIKSLDDSLATYIPEFKGYDYGRVTIRQLLTMTSGIAWNEDYSDSESDVAQMYLKPCQGKEAHILSYLKNLKQVHAPGTYWNYSTGETDLVGILVQKASGRSLADYLSEKIWQPFGMQQCAFWLTDECSGLNIGGSGLSASLRDYARIGLLMLQKGKIGNESIFDDEWLANAHAPLQATDDRGGGYGYLWWRNSDSSYLAIGIFGQMLYINPAKDLIIAQIAAWPKAGSKELSKERNAFINAVQKAL